MKILALEREIPGAEATRFQQFAVAEARRVWEMCQAGVIRETYFRADRSEAVLVLECASCDQAEAAMATLPYVQQGLIAFELIPLRAYPGFERLFGQGTPDATRVSGHHGVSESADERQ